MYVDKEHERSDLSTKLVRRLYAEIYPKYAIDGYKHNYSDLAPLAIALSANDRPKLVEQLQGSSPIIKAIAEILLDFLRMRELFQED